MQYWADFQSVHGFRCYDNTAPNAKCQRVLVAYSLCSMPGSVRDGEFAGVENEGAEISREVMYGKQGL